MTGRKLMVTALLLAALGSVLTLSGALANVVYQPNDIPLLDNRFRIDPDVAEVTIVIYRRSNTSPAILVRPDGSKLYAWRHPADTVRWLEADRYDIVTIDEPMPGPWQAIADYNVINRVRLLSQLQLKVSALPMKLYANERLKLTAAFQHQGQTLPGEEFMDRMALEARLVSYQRPEDDNFSISEIALSRLKDNGSDYDEHPRDGVYTYGSLLRVPAGKYKFIVSAANEVMTRGYQQDVLLYPDPIKMAVDSTEVGLPLHLDVKVDSDELQLDSVAYRGQINGVGDMAPLHLSGTLAQASVPIPMPSPTESGHYRLDMEWVATTLDGREVVIEPPEVRFTLFDPPPVEPPLAVPPMQQEASSWQLTTWIALVAGILLIMAILAGMGLWWLKGRNTRALLAQQSGTASPSQPDEPQPAAISDEDIDLNKLIKE